MTFARSQICTRLLLAVVIIQITSCSEEVRQRTWVRATTTDQDAHTVDLYRPTKPSPSLTYAYSLKLPRSYYEFRDNQYYTKQTDIGLGFDAPTLRSWAERFSTISGLERPLNQWFSTDAFDAASTRAMRTDKRRVYVSIIGAEGVPPDPRDFQKDMSWRGSPFDWKGYTVRYYDKSYVPSLPALRGHKKDFPQLSIDCAEGAPICSFDRLYRGSYVKIFLPRERAMEAGPFSDRLIHFLDQHVVAQSAAPD